LNERFLFRFRRPGGAWAVTGVGPGGVLFDEPDPRPRRVLLDFRPRGAVTTLRVESIRRSFDWHPWQFGLDAFADAGRLGFRGVTPEALPHGYYQAGLRVDGLRLRIRTPRFEIDPGGEAEIAVDARPDPRRVSLQLERCDPRIARVLDVPGSIDGLSPRAWLATGARDTRKACLLNILAVLRALPSRTTALVDAVERVFVVRDDRVYAAVDPSMYERVRAMALDPENRKFWAEGTPRSAIHRQLLAALPPPDAAAAYELRSFRAESPASLQIVFAVPPPGAPPRYYAEFDIDLGNPLQDVAGFAIHMGELASNHPTDHLDLRARLARRAAGEFLYYSVKNT